MTSEDKQAKIRELLAGINKKHKRTVIADASQARNAYTTRRSTGIVQLDRDLGGGLPGGGIVCVSGGDGAGKSYLSQKICGMNQRFRGKDSTILYVPTEHAFDHLHARRVGFVVAVPDAEIALRNEQRKMVGLEPFTKEEVRQLKKQIGTVELARPMYAEEMFDMVLDVAKSNYFQIIVIDSITAIRPKSLATAESVEDEGRQGAQSNAIKKFLLNYYPLLSSLDEDPNQTTLILTQQMVSNRRKAEAPSYMQKYLPDSIPSMSSHQLRHAKLTDILLKSMSMEKEKNDEGLKQAVQKTLQWEITKGKAGSHEGITGEVDFDFRSHVDSYRTLFTEATRLGMVNQGKKTFSIEGIPELQNVTYSAFEATIHENVDLEIKLRTLLMHKNGITCVYR